MYIIPLVAVITKLSDLFFSFMDAKLAKFRKLILAII